ncbi:MULTISPECIES: hypothetical protein [Desulfobacula]|uniref:Conserved uncharacterized protein n=2 Tax=Desulfobacula TaxID=28222 RepID=K0NL78_DESTT|nr:MULTISPECIES: hypothetical protein [Desulfobacula]CCK79457.1 conserved uncharacterized protein [Desulfobacula toluolica Tol2]SDT84345.1 hypothetical protein SAMN04487931_101210 [Desulfobacula phenolica]
MMGMAALFFFLFLLLASFRQWIRQDVLPLQSILVLGSLVLVVMAMVFNVEFRVSQIFSAATLHPITATIAGFLLAGAVDAAGGFKAAAKILTRISQGRILGLSGTIFLLVNVPTIFAMPCGRVWAAALIPATIMFGMTVARLQNRPSLVPAIVFGLIVNAAASCGPSPLGGIGMIVEGTAGYALHAFSNSQQISIMVITILTMFLVAFFSKITVPMDEAGPENREVKTLPDSAYFAFFLYMAGLGAVFIFEPPVPIQTVLLVMTIFVMAVGNVGFKSLVAGIIIHPVTAMVAGFMMAGALMVTGGFEALTTLLVWLATHTPLGFVGVGVVLIYIPVIFPMPCGRITAAALLPGVLMFGMEVSKSTGIDHCLPVMLVGFVVCCAASCAPSPLGGIGGIGEGNLRLKSGITANALQISILLGAPVAGLIVAGIGLTNRMFMLDEMAVSIGIAVICGILTNILSGYKPCKPGGILGGILVGVLIMVL